tara:strand:+ start:65 stop:895 length:831 start_codon:yes stop_codon:yes gene_type:complete
MKKCSKCKLEKEFSEFNKTKSCKEGLSSYCKSCNVITLKEWRFNNPSPSTIRIYKSKELAKELLLKGKKKCSKCKEIKSKTLFYNSTKQKQCKSCIRDYHKKRRNKKREEKNKLREETKHIREANKKKRQKLYYINNKEKYEKYYKQNKNKLNKQSTKNHNKRYSKDNLYRFKCLLRSRTSNAFTKSRWNKNTSNEEMLGCSYETAFKHIERQFIYGMNWKNQGEWHIDHIIPLASAKTEKRVKELCHYTNLQPLWALDNLRKSDSINGQQTLLRI